MYEAQDGAGRTCNRCRYCQQHHSKISRRPECRLTVRLRSDVSICNTIFKQSWYLDMPTAKVCRELPPNSMDRFVEPLSCSHQLQIVIGFDGVDSGLQLMALLEAL